MDPLQRFVFSKWFARTWAVLSFVYIVAALYTLIRPREPDWGEALMAAMVYAMPIGWLFLIFWLLRLRAAGTKLPGEAWIMIVVMAYLTFDFATAYPF